MLNFLFFLVLMIFLCNTLFKILGPSLLRMMFIPGPMESDRRCKSNKNYHICQFYQIMVSFDINCDFTYNQLWLVPSTIENSYLKAFIILLGSSFGIFVINWCLEPIIRVWILSLMTLSFCHSLGVLIDVNLKLIGTLG